MKQLLFQAALFISLTMSAQHRVNVAGMGKQIREGDVLYLSYTEQEKNRMDSVVAREGRFTFSCVVANPVKARIDRNENPMYAAVLTQSVYIYLEPGTVNINYSDQLAGALISGTGLNDTLQLLNNTLKPLRAKMRAIKDPDLFTQEERKDPTLLHHNKRELERLFYELADADIAFAIKYPHSYVSLDILADRSRINRYIDKVALAFENLSPSLRETTQGKLIAERIRKKRQVIKGMQAIDFTMTNSEGSEVQLASFKDKYVLLDFWASWCGPCRGDHPQLVALYNKYKDKGFTIVSVSIDTDKNDWLKAITKDKITWTQLSDLKGNKGTAYLQYGITSIPANFLIDPHGVVIAKDLKGDLLKDKLEKIFAEGN